MPNAGSARGYQELSALSAIPTATEEARDLTVCLCIGGADREHPVLPRRGAVPSCQLTRSLGQPEQTHVCGWSHGASARKHLHIAVQPVTAAVVASYGGLRSEHLRARMVASGDEPDAAALERFRDQARELFQTIRARDSELSAAARECPARKPSGTHRAVVN